MSDGLPEKIVRFDMLKLERGRKKLCTCFYPHYEIDERNRLIYCTDCGALVDPFEAIVKVASAYERDSKFVEQLLEQRKQIENYHPRRLVIKELEKRYERDSNLIPTCPHCHQPFDLEELRGVVWVGRRFAGYKE